MVKDAFLVYYKRLLGETKSNITPVNQEVVRSGATLTQGQKDDFNETFSRRGKAINFFH